MSDQSPWMTTTEARLYARCGRRQLLAALHTGELAGTQRTAPRGTWRIHRDDVDAWLRGLRPDSVERKPLRRVVPKRRAS